MSLVDPWLAGHGSQRAFFIAVYWYLGSTINKKCYGKFAHKFLLFISMKGVRKGNAFSILYRQFVSRKVTINIWNCDRFKLYAFICVVEFYFRYLTIKPRRNKRTIMFYTYFIVIIRKILCRVYKFALSQFRFKDSCNYSTICWINTKILAHLVKKCASRVSRVFMRISTVACALFVRKTGVQHDRWANIFLELVWKQVS